MRGDSTGLKVRLGSLFWWFDLDDKMLLSPITDISAVCGEEEQLRSPRMRDASGQTQKLPTDSLFFLPERGPVPIEPQALRGDASQDSKPESASFVSLKAL